jgi:hypothetical protein
MSAFALPGTRNESAAGASFGDFFRRPLSNTGMAGAVAGIAVLERIKTILALIVAGSLCFGLALAQDGAQDPEGQEAAGSEGAPAAGQEAAGSDAAPAAAEGETGDGGAGAESDPAGEAETDPSLDPEIYDPELDDQTYEGDDDVFVPTEEIPADEPIPFPTDI